MRKPALLTPTWKISFYSLILVIGCLIALPNILPQSILDRFPSWLPAHKVALGLDLRGGSHLVLEVDAKALIKEQMENMLLDARNMLREDKIVADSIKSENLSIVIGIIDEAKRQKAFNILKQMENTTGAIGFSGTQKQIEVTNAADGNIVVNMTEAGQAARVDLALGQSLEIVRKRIDQIGVAEPSIQRVGDDRIMVQLPGLEDPSELRRLLGSTAKMTFHLLSETGAGVGVKMMPDLDGTRDYPILTRVVLSGDRLTDAQPGQDPNSGKTSINFRFDSMGARQFAKITTDNVGKPFAIVLDGKVLSAPVINEPIPSGSGQITGNFTVKEASTISALLRAGALPAPLTVIEERTVGAGLGGDAIDMGIKTGLLGLALVFAFIVFLYGRWGWIANFALLLTVILIFAALSLLGATLSLPGIAGIILCIGIAVDANILINERIREELNKGRSAMASVDAGFDKAFATIVDSNVTGLIATFLLFVFGSGPVKGFALTIGLGMVISMFTAVAVVRIIMVEIVHRHRIKTIKMKPMIDFFPESTNIKFMNARYWGIAGSLILSAASVVLFFTPGLNYGVDFKGGIQIEANIQKAHDLGEFRSVLDELKLGGVELQSFGADEIILIRAERQPGDEKAQTEAVEKIKAAVKSVEPQVSFERVEVIGPKVSDELTQAGFFSVALACLCMLIYIWWRFEWYFAVGAIVTLILDITKTVGFFVITGLDFNLTAIAALLTLIGYSVNDKVVVYDRMREHMRLYKKMPLRDLIDESINLSLARCTYTSVTTFLSMLPMAIWGGSAVASFAIPIVFGVVVATTSSIFIAAPILLFLGDWRKGKKDRIDSPETAE